MTRFGLKCFPVSLFSHYEYLWGDFNALYHFFSADRVGEEPTDPSDETLVEQTTNETLYESEVRRENAK